MLFDCATQSRRLARYVRLNDTTEMEYSWVDPNDANHEPALVVSTKVHRVLLYEPQLVPCTQETCPSVVLWRVLEAYVQPEQQGRTRGVRASSIAPPSHGAPAALVGAGVGAAMAPAEASATVAAAAATRTPISEASPRRQTLAQVAARNLASVGCSVPRPPPPSRRQLVAPLPSSAPPFSVTSSTADGLPPTAAEEVADGAVDTDAAAAAEVTTLADLQTLLVTHAHGEWNILVDSVRAALRYRCTRCGITKKTRGPFDKHTCLAASAAH